MRYNIAHNLAYILATKCNEQKPEQNGKLKGVSHAIAVTRALPKKAGFLYHSACSQNW